MEEPSRRADESLPLPNAAPVVPEIAAKTEEAALGKPVVPSGSPKASSPEESDFELQRKAALLEGLRQDIDARKRYARNIFRLIVVWLIAIFLLLMLQGLFSEPDHVMRFRLSDAVLLALIGGTTANVLGLFIFVVQYLFPKRDA